MSADSPPELFRRPVPAPTLPAMTPLPHRTTALAIALSVVIVGGCAPDPGREADLDAEYLALLAAEDARPTEGANLATLIEGTTSDRPLLRQTAVRGLGRLEDPALAPEIGSVLGDPSAEVRRAAANAMAQAFQTSDGDEALALLLAQWTGENDPEVSGAIAQSIGRLTLTPANRRRAMEAIVAASFDGAGDVPVTTMTGVALGLEAMVRGAGDAGLGAEAADRLESLATYDAPDADDVAAARIRSLALTSLGQARRMSGAIIERALRDPAPSVRAAAVRYLDAVPPSERTELIEIALEDPFPQVVIEAVKHLARLAPNALHCGYLLAAAAPGVTSSVRLGALDALARPCPDVATQRTLLHQTALAIQSPQAGAWQTSAHAFVALSRLSRDDATPLLADFSGHDNDFVRAYGARGARWLDNEEVLRTLARDRTPNVRTAAIQGLYALMGHSIDDVLVSQFTHDDAQLLVTAAGLLEGTADSVQVATAAMAALERISTARRETRRDPRRALLERIGALGSTSLSDRMTPFLSDHDPLVAADAATILEAWNGQPYEAMPTPLDRQPLPTVTEFRRMKGATVLLHMQSGGTIEIALHAQLATTNVFRFVRLVDEGRFDGLTFHRWASNFVIQGGSPGANEYEGDGPYTRDEIGRVSHWRATVGISTRGHDTGDGQIFVNLIDNVRLDHAYTIIGTVVDGMDVVDSALEGATIERAEVRPAT